MLYTFSQASYDQSELERYFQYMTEKDAVVLWQDGVLLAIKQPALIENCKAPVYALDIDIQARGLVDLISEDLWINQEDLVDLTADVSPQFAL